MQSVESGLAAPICPRIRVVVDWIVDDHLKVALVRHQATKAGGTVARCPSNSSKMANRL